MNCVRCGHTVGWVECPTGGWWSHEVHPNDNHDAEIRCVHSMVKWDCLSCLQGHIRRVEAENQRYRDVLEKFALCPIYGHHVSYDSPRKRRIDCADDQCLNSKCVRYVECKHQSHDAVEALAGLIPRKDKP